MAGKNNKLDVAQNHAWFCPTTRLIFHHITHGFFMTSQSRRDVAEIVSGRKKKQTVNNSVFNNQCQRIKNKRNNDYQRL
jgi:hypothetical protein